MSILTDHGASLPTARALKPGVKSWAVSLVALGVVTGGVVAGPELLASPAVPPAAAQPPSVAVSAPLQRDVDGRLDLLGQFSAVQKVELRAQVGGTLTEIGFRTATSSRRATSRSRSTRYPTRSSSPRRPRR